MLKNHPDAANDSYIPPIYDGWFLTIHEKAKELKLKKIILNARKKSVGFYERAGYRKIAKAHTLFGKIEHFKMVYKL